MAEMNARERHVAEIKSVRTELEKLKKGTPHYRDTERRLKRLQKELKTYDYYWKK